MKANFGRAVLAATILSVASSFTAAAEKAYPTRPVKLVVGFPTGGPTDLIGRVIGQNLARELGKPVIIENMGGAGGTVAAGNVARASPDGYTLLVSVEASQTRAKVLYPKIAYDQIRSFTFIRKLAKQRSLLVVNPSMPVSSVKELITYAKAHPNELNLGGTIGATSHIAGTVFNKLNDTKMTFVSYAGGNQPITDLMTGTLQVGFFTEATVSELVKAGKLKALAITANERSPALPDVPTVEQGGGKAMDISPWFGVVGPAGLPITVTRRLEEAFDKISASQEFLSQIEVLGASPIKDSRSQKFSAEVEEEIRYWTLWAEENKAQAQ